MYGLDLYVYAQKVIDFIHEKHFEPVTQRTPYYHMGATITDSILQAGLNYRFVVYPRVLGLLSKFNEYTTTCDFLILIQTVPLGELICWNNENKLRTISDLAWFLYNNGIENEDQLALSLEVEDNIAELKKIKGIGPKTIDYLKMLSGSQSIAIDRHLFTFLELAGVSIKSYEEARLIYTMVADMLRISKYELDKKIWTYMST